jgi:hypothetical protein
MTTADSCQLVFVLLGIANLFLFVIILFTKLK